MKHSKVIFLALVLALLTVAACALAEGQFEPLLQPRPPVPSTCEPAVPGALRPPQPPAASIKDTMQLVPAPAGPPLPPSTEGREVVLAEKPVPIMPLHTPQRPLPVPPPVSAEDSYRELLHVYREYDATIVLVRELGAYEKVSELLDIARKAYEKALEYYMEKDYAASRVYAHLALESLHGARDLALYEALER